MPDLVPDLREYILQLVHYKDPWTPDLRTLSNLALVSRGWRWPAQALLFYHVRLRTRSAARAFRAATARCQPHGQYLSSLVRILDVKIRGDICLQGDDAFTIYDFAPVLARCPRLYQVNLILDRLFRVEPKTLAAIRRASPPIAAVRCQYTLALWYTWADGAMDLLSTWPSLQFLEFAGCWPRTCFPKQSGNPPPPFLLRKLTMAGKGIPPYEILEWVLENSRDTLEELSAPNIVVQLPFAQSYMVAAGAKATANIRSLYLPLGDLEHLVPMCPRIEQIFVTREAGPSLFAPETGLIDRLPDTIQHIGYVIGTTQKARREDVRSILCAKMRSQLPNLQSITCCDNAIDPSQPGKESAEYQKLCRDMTQAGIDFILYEGTVHDFFGCKTRAQLPLLPGPSGERNRLTCTASMNLWLEDHPATFDPPPSPEPELEVITPPEKPVGKGRRMSWWKKMAVWLKWRRTGEA